MKFSGKIGFQITEETDPGVYVPTIIEKSVVGDILQSGYREDLAGNVNPNLNIDCRISIVMNSFIKANYGYIRYVEYGGSKWEVKSISTPYPRLILTLGGLYNG